MRENRNFRTLLDMAKSNLELAEFNLERKTDDECQLNLTGYHVQQCIELTLKHEIEMNGEKYPRTHDIGDLLESYGFFDDYENYVELRDFAPKITEIGRQIHDMIKIL